MATPKRDRELTRREQRVERKAAFAKKSQGDAGAALFDAYTDIDALEHTVELLQGKLLEAEALNRQLTDDVAALESLNMDLERAMYAEQDEEEDVKEIT
jgi:hypothetical protein